MVTFQQAYEAAAARYAPEVWADMGPDLRIKAIYEEMRRLDAEVAAVMDDAHIAQRSARNTEYQKIDRPRVARKPRPAFQPRPRCRSDPWPIWSA